MAKKWWSDDMAANSDPYRKRARIRVNGLLVRDRSLLLVKLRSPVAEKVVWIPPGGGVEYGETVEQCLIREFREETGLSVKAGHLRYINELVKAPYHAVEFYFDVEEAGGEIEPGSDPEHSSQEQLILDLQFIPFTEFPNYEIVPDYVKQEFPSEIDSGIRAVRFFPADL